MINGMNGKYFKIIPNYDCERFAVVDKRNRLLTTYIVFDSFFPNESKLWRLHIYPSKKIGLSKEFDEVWKFIDELTKNYPNGWCNE